MVKDKIVYQRTQVAIKEQISSSATTFKDVVGTITLLDNERRIFFRFIPFGLDDSINDDWAMVQETPAVFSYRSTEKDSVSMTANPLNKYRVYFQLNDLQSVRRVHPPNDVGQLIFTLKDGRVLPTLHFKLSGSKELINLLCQYLPLQK